MPAKAVPAKLSIKRENRFHHSGQDQSEADGAREVREPGQVDVSLDELFGE